MLEKIFQSAGSFLKAVICGALLIAAAAGAITVTLFLIMTCWRAVGLLWREVFRVPWTF